MRMRRIAPFIAGILLVVSTAYAEDRMVDQIVADINGEAISRFDVERFWRLEALLNGQNWRGTPTIAIMGPALIRFLNRSLILEEMDRLGSMPDPNLEMNTVYREFLAYFRSDDERRLFLSLVSSGEQEMTAMIFRQKQLMVFMQKRVDLYVAVTPGMVEEELKRITGGAEITPATRQNMRRQIEKRLILQQQKDVINQWLKDLHRRRKVRILVPWAPDPFASDNGPAGR